MYYLPTTTRAVLDICLFEIKLYKGMGCVTCSTVSLKQTYLT